MVEYIDRQEAINAVLSCFGVEDSIFSDATVMAIGFKLKDIPAADVQPVVHSLWDKHGYCIPCLNCGWDSGFAHTLLERKVRLEYKYCPNCGARMDGGENG